MSIFTRYLGPRYYQMARNWMVTGAAFYGATAAAGLYFSEWKAVLQYVPYYGGKYDSKPPL